MGNRVEVDFIDMEKKLQHYVDNGKSASPAKVRFEPLVGVKPDASLIKPLRKIKNFNGSFTAIDCSTRTLKRANNWGIYLMRTSSASIVGKEVKWHFLERICTVIGDAHVRRSYLQDFRTELESQMALKLLKEEILPSYYVHPHVRSTYLLLDGGGHFGGEKRFRVSLYDECKKNEVQLLAISKNAPSLHDDKGRDLLATTYMMSPYDIWAYYPVRKADKDRSLYGDIAIVKLCAESSHVFRCDIMDYLTSQDIYELLSPLTSVSEDPRCLGYPVSLWLAHEFSAPSDSMLLFYHDQIEAIMKSAGLYEVLKREELCCSFADEVHGVKYPFEWEGWYDQL